MYFWTATLILVMSVNSASAVICYVGVGNMPTLQKDCGTTSDKCVRGTMGGNISWSCFSDLNWSLYPGVSKHVGCQTLGLAIEFCICKGDKCFTSLASTTATTTPTQKTSKMTSVVAGSTTATVATPAQKETSTSTRGTTTMGHVSSKPTAKPTTTKTTKNVAKSTPPTVSTGTTMKSTTTYKITVTKSQSPASTARTTTTTKPTAKPSPLPVSIRTTAKAITTQKPATKSTSASTTTAKTTIKSTKSVATTTKHTTTPRKPKLAVPPARQVKSTNVTSTEASVANQEMNKSVHTASEVNMNVPLRPYKAPVSTTVKSAIKPTVIAIVASKQGRKSTTQTPARNSKQRRLPATRPKQVAAKTFSRSDGVGVCSSIISVFLFTGLSVYFTLHRCYC